MDLRKKVREFLYDTGATVTNFCKKVEISTTYYYKWQSKESELSEGLKKNIENYLKEVYAK